MLLAKMRYGALLLLVMVGSRRRIGLTMGTTPVQSGIPHCAKLYSKRRTVEARVDISHREARIGRSTDRSGRRHVCHGTGRRVRGGAGDR